MKEKKNAGKKFEIVHDSQHQSGNKIFKKLINTNHNSNSGVAYVCQIITTFIQ